MYYYKFKHQWHYIVLTNLWNCNCKLLILFLQLGTLVRRGIPWRASILFQGKVKCSGALVDKEHVVTTRSCVSGFNNKNRNNEKFWDVLLGDYTKYRDFGELKFKIASVIYPSSTSDIALIRLVPFSSFRYRILSRGQIKPIEISATDSSSTPSLSVWASRRVHRLNIVLANERVCKNVFTSFDQRNNICTLPASFPCVQRSMFSGSPLVQYRNGIPTLIGLLTNIEEVNKPLGEPRFARYIRVSQFWPWLKNNLGNNVA